MEGFGSSRVGEFGVWGGGGFGGGGSRVGELRGFGGPIAQHSEEAGSIANTDISQTPSCDEFCSNMWEECRGCHFGIREIF